MKEPTTIPDWLQWLAWYVQEEPIVVLVVCLCAVVLWLLRDRVQILKRLYKDDEQ